VTPFHTGTAAPVGVGVVVPGWLVVEVGNVVTVVGGLEVVVLVVVELVVVELVVVETVVVVRMVDVDPLPSDVEVVSNEFAPPHPPDTRTTARREARMARHVIRPSSIARPGVSTECPSRC
jgi:hypothetical protein